MIPSKDFKKNVNCTSCITFPHKSIPEMCTNCSCDVTPQLTQKGAESGGKWVPVVS